ncbi:MAG: dolichyl-phosphate beta-glucosyltransferase [Acidimicrobiales bacterium]
MTLELTIIVPAFDEAHRLADGVKRFDAAVDAGAIDLGSTEVVVVDDGSTDGTADTARSLLAHLPHHRVVSLPVNRGKGAAIRTGVSLAEGDCTAYMDADMAIDPRAVPGLLAGLGTNDVVIGSRALADSMVDGTYALRAVMGRLFNRMVTTGTGLGLHDTQCGFKAFRTPVARLLFHLVRIDRFAFDVEVLVRARRLGLRTSEIPVHWKHVPGSTIHPLHDSVTMLADVYRSRLGLVPSPPLTAVVVADPTAERPGSSPLRDQVADVVAGTLVGVPVPVVADGSSVLALLPLVDPDDAATVLSALRAEFAPLPVFRRAMTMDALAELGPLTGRLQAPWRPSRNERRPS